MKTTKEQADQDIHENLVNNLQELLEKNIDAEEGYSKAMKDPKNNRLKSFLQHQATKRSQFVTELNQEIRNLNETPKEKGSTTGSLHRTWIDIKSSLTGNDDEAVLEECIRGEKSSVEETATSITQISEDNMANAIRMISVVEGHDPREFSLISFGGAGPLHATAIARKLSIPKVIIPVVPGNTSALGFLLADLRIDKIHTFPMRSDALDVDRINQQFKDAEASAAQELRADKYTGNIFWLKIFFIKILC